MQLPDENQEAAEAIEDLARVQTAIDYSLAETQLSLESLKE